MPLDKSNPPKAPGGLWLFGEEGHSDIVISNADLLETAKQLFPEANIYAMDRETEGSFRAHYEPAH